MTGFNPASVPIDLADGGTITGDLTIAAPDTEARFRVRIGSDTNATVDAGVTDAGAGKKDTVLNVEADGGGVASMQVTNHGGDNNSVVIEGLGTIDAYTTTGSYAFRAWDSPGNVLRFALLPAGQPMIGVLAAPADGALAASQVALWFDSTDGVGNTKLMVKGKSADGTVKTATILLA